MCIRDRIFESVVFFVAGLGGGFDSSICVPVQYVTPSIYGLSDQKKLQDNDAAGAGPRRSPGFPINCRSSVNDTRSF